MKTALEDVGLTHRSHFLVKISAFVFVASVAVLYVGKKLTDEDQQLLFFNYDQFTANITTASNPQSQSPLASISPNHNKPSKKRNVHNGEFANAAPTVNFSIPNLPVVERFGVVDENGVMTNEFRIGDLSDEVTEILRNVSSGREDVEGLVDDGEIGVEGGVTSFAQCPENTTNYFPCLDNVDEEHCPEKGKGLDCLIPRPKDYKRPVPWPKSRDEVWYSNVPHTQLIEDKGSQNGISIAKDKIQFSGGDIQFIHGPDHYIKHISKMVPDIAFGQQTRVVLDVGCGVASFGAHLMSRNVLTLSIVPKIVHENQVQFALERGVPATVAAFGTHRLSYPSQAFDLIHCSGCGIDWTRDDGILLVELNRILRAGGYFVYKREVNFEEQWKAMVDLAARLCWELVKEEGQISIWKKPQNNLSYLTRQEGTRPPLCDADDDPDNVWNATLKPCISRLPENGYGANVSTWPVRLNNPPDRLQTINIEAYISRKELYRAESRYADEVVGNNVKYMHWKEIGIRNVLDMRAGFGGFAAAFINHKIDCWVMNVVPVSGPNTLPVIYDRGLVGVMHDWCEPFDTYPRTYDLLHASGLFSAERSRCDSTSIMLEMDRILRPGGYAYIQDSIKVIYKLQELGKAMGWHMQIQDMGEGPEASYKVLVCQKPLDGENFVQDTVRHRRPHKRSHKKDHH